MIPADIKPILDALLAKSERGQVNWLEAKTLGLRPNIDYAVNMGPYTVALELNVDEEGDPTSLDFFLMNEDGKVAVLVTVFPGDKDEYAFLNRLFQVARRRALKADQILADLQARLQDDAPMGRGPGEPPPTSSGLGRGSQRR
jgi:hypothetical protein